MKRYSAPPTPPSPPEGMSQEEMTREIYRRVVGDGTEGNPGLTVRMDRVERFVSTAKWIIGTAAATAIGLVVTWLVGLWKSSK